MISTRKLSDGDEAGWVDKLREDDIGQLVRFCKMHIATVVDMDKEGFENLFGQQQSSTPSFKHNIAAALLPKKKGSRRVGSSSFYDCSALDIPPTVDREITKLIDYLHISKNFCHEGLFRKTGSIARQKELAERLSDIQPSDINSESYTVHDCASVLKAKLAGLSEPLLMDRYFNAFMHSENIERYGDRLKFLTNLLQMLPTRRYKIAKTLFNLLHQVAQSSTENKMDANNLGAVIAPNILCPKNYGGTDLQSLAVPMQKVISFIILNVPTLFEVPEILAWDCKRHLKKAVPVRMSSSEESLLSMDSLESPNFTTRLRKRKSGNVSSASCETLDEQPIDTVLSYTVRQQTAAGTSKPGQDTEVELAKLYAHVSSMPDSSKKRKIMKQFNEANGYHQQASVARNHSRSRSLGESIKRRFSKKSRLRTLNISCDNPISAGHTSENDVINGSSPLVTITNIISTKSTSKVHSPHSSLKHKTTGAEDRIEITALDTSPYSTHRTSRKNLRLQSIEGQGGEVAEGCSTDTNDSQSRVHGDSYSSSSSRGEGTAPQMRKALLPSGALQSDSTPPIKSKLRNQMVKEHRGTPPICPRKMMSVMDKAVDV